MSLDKEKNDLIEELKKTFSVPISMSSDLDSESAFFKMLKDKIAFIIEELIRSDMDRLMYILYRIDIAEKRTSMAFDLGITKEVSEMLADLIIERQFKKVKYRIKFNQDNGS